MIHTEMLNILGWKKDDLSNLQFIGFSYIKQGKFDIAKTLFEALEVLDPEDAYNLNTLGGLYIETKEPYKALNVLEKALMLDPQNENSQYNRIQALLSLGFRKQALEACLFLSQGKDPILKSKAEALLLAEKLG
jgi:tetratricopeptide (TPR) repeat protein